MECCGTWSKICLWKDILLRADEEAYTHPEEQFQQLAWSHQAFAVLELGATYASTGRYSTQSWRRSQDSSRRTFLVPNWKPPSIRCISTSSKIYLCRKVRHCREDSLLRADKEGKTNPKEPIQHLNGTTKHWLRQHLKQSMSLQESYSTQSWGRSWDTTRETISIPNWKLPSTCYVSTWTKVSL